MCVVVTSVRALKKAFRKCAIKWHPDKFVGKTDEEKEEADVTPKGFEFIFISTHEKFALVETQ